ncbi:MAG: LacI family transcriptional regulator, partial [Oscillospiraceae bacterium]|nr:LacI family transcriptional regulator [Oscillospiraceae bacterium]
MTIKDIARLSGVGVTTVSRVLNQHPDVSEETRRRVLAVVEEQGFQPNTNARHLKQQTSASIAVIVKGTMNMLFADLVERCQQLLQDAGRDANLYYLDEDANEVAYAVQLCRERKPLGILFLGG